MKEERRKEYEQTEEFKETQKILQEHREKRGATLMEEHLSKMSEAKKQKIADGRAAERRPFDREMVRQRRESCDRMVLMDCRMCYRIASSLEVM